MASQLKSGLATAGKAAAVGIGAATSAVTALSKVALDSYADYEQLVGGVETLFGAGGKSAQEYAEACGKSVAEVADEYNKLMQSQNKVLAYADEAYKNAGMSANQYMETVTGFSASLLQSLDGDTFAAAQAANQAIIDMSDNANKMGTDMSMIQNAYQGFAKQNYTMLDNLKLGYGGTKEEMSRLLEDATAISGVKYDLSSYADVVEAIHIIQTEMGITGTTAKEASSTISGSLSAAKAAISNLMVGIADENADMDTLIDNVVESVTIAAGNILPRAEQILSGIGTMVSKMAPLVGDAVTMLVGDVLPQFIQAGSELIGEVGSALLDQSDILIQDGFEMVLMLAEGLAKGIPELLVGASRIVESLAVWLTEYSSVIIDTGGSIITALAEGVIQSLPMLKEAASWILSGFIGFFEYDFPEILETGVALINQMTDGILSELPNMVSQLPAIVEAIIDFIMNNLPVILEAGISILLNIAEGIANTIPKLIPVMLDVINQILETVQSNLPKIIELGFNLLLKFVDGIANATSNLVSQIYQIRDLIISGLSEAVGRVFDIGINIVEGLWNGISSMWSWLTDKVSGVVDSVVGVFTEGLDIHSPSRVFRDKIGGNIVLGLAEGITENAGKVYKALGGMTSNLLKEAEIPISSYKNNADLFGTRNGRAGGLIMNFYVTILGTIDEVSAEKYGKILGDKAAREMRAKGVIT